MILGDVQKPGCIGMKVTDAFELESGGFRNNGVARARFGCMFGNWNADVAENKRLAFAVCFEYFAGKRSGCGFSVRAADAHKMRSSAAITITEFNFADNFNAAALCLADKWSENRNYGGNDHQVHSVQKCFGSFAEFVGVFNAGKGFLKPGNDRLYIVNDHVIPVSVKQFCARNAAFCHSDDQCGFFHIESRPFVVYRFYSVN